MIRAAGLVAASAATIIGATQASAATHPRPPAAGELRIAALGDSYASGTGPGVFSPAERTAGNQVSRAIDGSLRAAGVAASARGVRVDVVSPYVRHGKVGPEFRGHALCEAGAPFYRGLEATAPGQEGPEAVLHLDKAGQAAMATLIERKLGRRA